MRTETQLDAIRRRIINVVGHALRTPVTTLNGMADELAARADDAGARAVLIEGVQRNARILEQLLDDLLIASGVSTALPVDETVDVDVAASVRDVWAALGSPGEVKIHGDAVAHAQRSVIEQSLAKLLHNAAQYGDGSLEVRLQATADRVLVEIASNGGLPTEEELALSPEIFYRGEHAVMTAPGLGLGLPVARALVEHAGGSLTVRVTSDRFIATMELPGHG